MSNIFQLIEQHVDDGYRKTIGIFSTFEKAKEKLDKICRHDYYEYYIKEWKIDDCCWVNLYKHRKPGYLYYGGS